LAYFCKKLLAPGPTMHRVRIAAIFANRKLMLATYVNYIYGVIGWHINCLFLLPASPFRASWVIHKFYNFSHANQ